MRSGVVVFASIIMIAGCRGGDVEPTEVIATYDGGSLTRLEMEEHLLRQRAATGGQDRRGKAWRRAAIEEAVFSKILVADLGTDVAVTAAVDEATDRVHEQAMRRHLGWDDLAIEESEARAYYREHADEFVEPDRLRLQHIFLRAEEASLDAEARQVVFERLQEVRRQAVAGRDFGELARRYSDSADGSAGGWMVLERGARAVRSFTDVAWALDEDEISEIVESPTGFHLAKLATRVPAIERPFEDVREQIETALESGRLAELEAAYLTTEGPAHQLERRYENLDLHGVQPSAVVLRIGDRELTVADMLDLLPERYVPHFHAGYSPHIERFLDQRALRSILAREARAAGIDQQADVVKRLTRQVAEIRTTMAAELRLDAWFAAVPESELREFWARNRSRYEVPRRRSVSIIRLPPVPGENLWVTVARGERLAKEIRAGVDFAQVARSRSRHASSADGGRLVDQTDEELRVRIQSRARGRRIIDDLTIGEVSPAFIGEVYDPHRLQYIAVGVFIVRLDDETLERPATFEEARAEVENNYRRRYSAEVLTQLRSATLTEKGLEIMTEEFD